MKAEPRAAAHRAAVLVILAAAFWWHEWMPAAAVVAFVVWALLHRRYQGIRREGFMRLRRRLWPPAPLVLAVLIVGSLVMYVTSTLALEVRVLPIALNVLAAGLIVWGGWSRVATP